MTWLGSWLGKFAGSWLGTSEPVTPGILSGRLTGSSSLSGSLQVTGVEQVFDDISAALAGSSTVTGGLEVIEVVHVVDDMSAMLEGGSSLTGTITTQPEQQVPAGGLFSRFRNLWKRQPIYINLAANLRGSSRSIGRLQSIVTLRSTITGYSTLHGKGITTIVVPVKQAKEAAPVKEPETTQPIIPVLNEANTQVTYNLSAYMQGRSTFRAGLITVRRLPTVAADNHDDDEMAMLLLLVA